MRPARQQKWVARRTSEAWLARSLIAVAIALVGLSSIGFTLAQVVNRRDPALAHRLAPWDSKSTALLAASLSGLDATAADRVRADGFAREALRGNPASMMAVSVLGINAQTRGDTAAARRYFAYSESLSRRDLQTQLWAIEDAVGRQDIPGALRHYDTALRVSPSVAKLLFPVLGAASSDPEIQTELVRTLRHRPPWAGDLITFIASSGSPPAPTAQLFAALDRAQIPVSEPAQGALINALIAAGENDRAWNYYATIRPGADRRRSRDPGFTPLRTYPSVLDWLPIATNGANVTVQMAGSTNVAYFDVPAAVTGPLLQQLQLLPPGQYRLTGRASGLTDGDGSLPYWVVSCSSDRSLGQAPFKTMASGSASFDMTFTVPADCPKQVVVLMSGSSEAAGGTRGQIDRAEIVPLAASGASRS